MKRQWRSIFFPENYFDNLNKLTLGLLKLYTYFLYVLPPFYLRLRDRISDVPCLNIALSDD